MHADGDELNCEDAYVRFYIDDVGEEVDVGEKPDLVYEGILRRASKERANEMETYSNPVKEDDRFLRLGSVWSIPIRELRR